MINLTKERLLKNKEFQDEFRVLLGSQWIQTVMQLGMHENRKMFPVSRHPVSDVLHHSALRDAYTQGSIDLFEYFLNFLNVEEDDDFEQGIEPLENELI